MDQLNKIRVKAVADVTTSEAAWIYSIHFEYLLRVLEKAGQFDFLQAAGTIGAGACLVANYY